jgi:hypothetical protein
MTRTTLSNDDCDFDFDDPEQREAVDLENVYGLLTKEEIDMQFAWLLQREEEERANKEDLQQQVPQQRPVRATDGNLDFDEHILEMARKESRLNNGNNSRRGQVNIDDYDPYSLRRFDRDANALLQARDRGQRAPAARAAPPQQRPQPLRAAGAGQQQLLLQEDEDEMLARAIAESLQYN